MTPREQLSQISAKIIRYVPNHYIIIIGSIMRWSLFMVGIKNSKPGHYLRSSNNVYFILLHI